MPRFPSTLLLALLVACSTTPPAGQPLREEVLTEAQQRALTPYDVIELLREGNGRFVRNELTLRDHSEMVRRSTKAQ
jgi:hypothetical protein